MNNFLPKADIHEAEPGSPVNNSEDEDDVAAQPKIASDQNANVRIDVEDKRDKVIKTSDPLEYIIDLDGTINFNSPSVFFLSINKK